MRIPFFSSGHALDKYRHGDRPFALVTGASAGIGRALAFELATLSFNVIIHGRNKDKLAAVRHEILKEHPEVSVVCLVHDAAIKADWPLLMKQIEGLNIVVLINNIGTSSPIPWNAFETATDEQIETVIRVNTIFPTQITRNLLPTLIKNSPSLILNMTSASVILGPPLLSVYSGTKAANMIWSKALSNELSLLKRDVTCKAVMTATVQSEGWNRPTDASTPSSKEYAASMLARAGSSGFMYAGWWRHSIQLAVVQLMAYLPAFVIQSVIAMVTKDVIEWRQSVGDETAMKPF